MDGLQDHQEIVVRQNKEWGEILTGLEGTNRYTLFDRQGNELYTAGEVAGGTLWRWVLKAARPFTINVMDRSGRIVLRLERPFRFFFHELKVSDGHCTHIGTIRKRFTFFRRRYDVMDRFGRFACELFGPIFHPWTFDIHQRGRKKGKITKKWSGGMKELFTDADNFGIRFPNEASGDLKSILLGAVFLIDFVHFENSGSRNN